MAQGVRKDKLGGRHRDRQGISGAVLGLRLVSVADGYLSQPSDLWGRLLDRKWRDVRLKGCGETGNQGLG